MPDLLQLAKAADFAAQAHIGQLRKYTDEPYIVHPLAVAKTVADFGGTVEQVIAAMLHDTVEDVDHITLPVIQLNFGGVVAEYVDGMTKREWPEAKNREMRKTNEAQRLAMTAGEVQTIKYADIIDNTKTIVQFDHKFGAVYLEEASRLLNVMKNGNEALRQFAIAHINAEKEKLQVMTGK